MNAMKAILLAIALLFPTVTQAVSPAEIKQAQEVVAKIYWPNDLPDIYRAIKTQNPNHEQPLKVAFAVGRVAEALNVDWQLVLAIAKEESQLCSKRWLIGDGGRAAGCMQVNFRWWKKTVEEAGLTFDDLLEPRTGILIGTLILKYKLNRYGPYEGIKRYNGKGQAAINYRERVIKTYKQHKG